MNYVKSLAKQLAPKGIRVNAVAPGPIWTPLQVSGGTTQKNLKSSAVRLPWDVLISQPNWPLSMSSVRRVTLALQRAEFMAPPVARVSHERREFSCRVCLFITGCEHMVHECRTL